MGIRRGQAVEIEALAGLWERSVRATHTFLSESDIVALRPEVRRALGAPGVWVAEVDGVAVGFLILDGNTIEALFVEPARRGGGVGTRLLEHARAQCAEATELRVDVNEQNPTALGFYRKRGFEVIGRSPVDGAGRPFPLLHMALRLAPGDEADAEGSNEAMFRAMRRTDKERSREEAQAMLWDAPHGTLALAGDEGYPYAVPISHAYADGKLYFHGATAGHKFDALQRDNRASFSVIVRDDVVPEKFTTHYLSAIAFGRIRILTDPEERRRAMDALIQKYSPGHEAAGRKMAVAANDRLGVFAMSIEHLTAKGVLAGARPENDITETTATAWPPGPTSPNGG